MGQSWQKKESNWCRRWSLWFSLRWSLNKSTVNSHYVTISTLSSHMTHCVHLCYKTNTFLGFKNVECEELLSLRKQIRENILVVWWLEKCTHTCCHKFDQICALAIWFSVSTPLFLLFTLVAPRWNCKTLKFFGSSWFLKWGCVKHKQKQNASKFHQTSQKPSQLIHLKRTQSSHWLSW